MWRRVYILRNKWLGIINSENQRLDGFEVFTSKEAKARAIWKWSELLIELWRNTACVAVAIQLKESRFQSYTCYFHLIGKEKSSTSSRIHYLFTLPSLGHNMIGRCWQSSLEFDGDIDCCCKYKYNRFEKVQNLCRTKTISQVGVIPELLTLYPYTKNSLTIKFVKYKEHWETAFSY